MTGDVFINGLDAFSNWGINFEDGALSALMCPAPMKSFIQSKRRLQHGKTVVNKEPRYDERDISLPFHLLAKTKEEFLTKFSGFCSSVLANGAFTVTTRYQTGVMYRLQYLSCSQFTQYEQEKAIFVLKVCEPDPTNRSIPTPEE